MPLLGSLIKKAIELRGKQSNLINPRNPYNAQVAVLRKLLRKASFTAFGEKYRFAAILGQKQNIVQAYKQSVPVYDYNKIFNEWWYRSLTGETFVCWPGKVNYFALSSGTSESSSKQIPVTADMIRAIQRTSIKQILSLARYDFSTEFYQKGILMLGGSTHLQFNGKYYEGDLSGITAGNIPFWFQHFYKPGKEVSKQRNWQSKLDDIVKHAPSWDIGVICGVPAWVQILIEKILKEYNLKHIHEIWPNFDVYVHGGVSFVPYANSFKKLLGRPIRYMETYLASEGFIAFQSRPDTEAMQLVLDNGIFYEFVPFNENNFDAENNLVNNPETFTINEVETGKEYALLLSTCAGVWRYLIGDTIKFVSLNPVEIVITGRTKHFLSICGEHLSVENMNRAIQMLEAETGVHIREFAVAGIKYESMFAHQWYLGADEVVNAEDLAIRLDKHLKNLNDDYRVERLEAIKNVFVKVLPVQLFYDWMKSEGKEGAQNKFPRVLNNTKLVNWELYINKHL